MVSREDVIRMAREAGLKVGTNISGVMLVGSPSTPGIAHIDIEEMGRFAALVAAHEREACAKVCGELADNPENSEQYRMGANWARERIKARRST